MEKTTNPVETTENLAPEVKPELSTPAEEVAAPAPEPQPSKKLWYFGGAIVVLLLVFVGLWFFLNQKPKTTPPPKTVPAVQQPTPKPTLPRSKAPGVIISVQTASSLDAQGKAVAPVTTFAKTEKNIYLALTVNKPVVGTKIEYIRYLDGKYLDSGTNKILKPNITYTSFVWSLTKTGAAHPVGTYKVKIYTNGIFEKETSYRVQ